MKQITTSLGSFEQLFVHFELEFASNLVTVIWRVIAAVQSFFPSRDHARQHR